MRRTRRRGPSNGVVGILVLAAAAVLTYFAFNKHVPFRHHYTVSAVFRTANGVRPGSPVRIAGVDVGKVTGVEHVDGGRAAALVRMQIDERGLPLHRDAHAAIRPRIFLEGNFFVDLAPGSPSAPRLSDGDTIPVNQTSGPVQLDQVLTALQSDTRRQLQVLLDQYSRGIAGSGAKGYRASMRYWKPAYRDSAIVAEAQLGENPHDLSAYLDHAGTVAGAVDRSPGRLQDLVTDFDTTAHAFASNDRALMAALGELPRTLRTGRTALETLNAAFPATRGLVHDLRPAVRSSGPALDAAVPFAEQLRALVSQPELRGLVAALRPAVPPLAQLNNRTIPLYEQVRAASSCQNEVILPWTHDKIDDKTFPTDLKVFEEATKPLGGLAGESRSGDANGQWFRVLAGGPSFAYPMGTDRFFLTSAPLLGTNPAKPAKASPLRPGVPCETQQAPDLRSVPGAAPEGRKVTIPAAAQAGYQKIVDKAAEGLRRDIRRQGLGDQLKVSTEPVTKQQLEAAAQQVRQAAGSTP
jgi:phospholipid/cholesterol/gamma-HCH transport system substrate-binding protein